MLLNLASVEIVLSITDIIYWILVESGYSEEERITQIIVVVNCGIYCTYYLIMIFITIDRLIATQFAFSYKVVFFPTRIKAIMAFCWVLGMVSSVPFLFIAYHYIYDIYFKILFLVFDGIFLLVAIAAYGGIYHKLLKRRHLFSGNYTSTRSIPENGNNQFQRTASLIIISLLVLFVIPDITYVVLFIIYEIKHDLSKNVILILWEIHFIVDPAIYIYYQKSIKGLIRRKLSHQRSVFRQITVRRLRSASIASTDSSMNIFPPNEVTLKRFEMGQ